VEIKEVEHWMDLRIGQDVMVVRRDGPHPGVPVLQRIAKIVVCDWTPEEARELNVPMREVTYKFVDGTTASDEDDKIMGFRVEEDYFHNRP